MARDSSLIQNIHTVSGSNKIIRWVQGIKGPSREVGHPVTSEAEFKDEWIYTSTIHVYPYGVDKEELKCDLSIFHLARIKTQGMFMGTFDRCFTNYKKICTLL
jgi:hypothetical protein